jgi:hypothetical protein
MKKSKELEATLSFASAPWVIKDCDVIFKTIENQCLPHFIQFFQLLLGSKRKLNASGQVLFSVQPKAFLVRCVRAPQGPVNNLHDPQETLL